MGSATIHIQANLVWAGTRTARGTFVACCDPIGLTLEAEDESEMASMIAEAQHALLLDLFEDGELQKFLLDRGWKPTEPLPVQMPEGGVRFDVPFSVESAHGHA